MKTGVSISNSEFCTLSKMGRITNFLMWLHKQIEEKGCEVRQGCHIYEIHSSARCVMNTRLSPQTDLPLSVHFSRFDMLTPIFEEVKRTIQKYMKQVRPKRALGQTWKTFLRNHAADIWACDFLSVTDLFFRPL